MLKKLKSLINSDLISILVMVGLLVSGLTSQSTGFLNMVNKATIVLATITLLLIAVKHLFGFIIKRCTKNESTNKTTPRSNTKKSCGLCDVVRCACKNGCKFPARSFGEAIEALKQGKRVSREGWNGKGMFIFLRPADELFVDMIVRVVKSVPQSVKDFLAQKTDPSDPSRLDAFDKVKFNAYFCMYAADGSIVNGWLASQTDMLAEDWVILD